MENYIDIALLLNQSVFMNFSYRGGYRKYSLEPANEHRTDEINNIDGLKSDLLIIIPEIRVHTVRRSQHMMKDSRRWLT